MRYDHLPTYFDSLLESNEEKEGVLPSRSLTSGMHCIIIHSTEMQVYHIPTKKRIW
jgi:hypothetical protein